MNSLGVWPLFCSRRPQHLGEVWSPNHFYLYGVMRSYDCLFDFEAFFHRALFPYRREEIVNHPSYRTGGPFPFGHMCLSLDIQAFTQQFLSWVVKITPPYTGNCEHSQKVLDLTKGGDSVYLPSMANVTGDYDQFLILFQLNMKCGPIKAPLLDALMFDCVEHV